MSNMSVLENIISSYDILFSAEKKVADYVLKHPQETLDLNVVELANKSKVSDATVIRFCKHIGYAGYYQFRIMLAKTLPLPAKEEANKKQNTTENDAFAGFIKTI